MADALPKSNETRTATRGHYGLRTLLLVVAVVACWLARRQAASDVEQIKRELPGLRRATRELVIKDATQLAVVEKPQIWPGEFRWEVYVPEGRTGHVHLALDGLTARGYPTPLCSLAVHSGINLIEYQKSKTDDGWRFSLRSGNEVKRMTRPKEWLKRTVFTNYVAPITETLAHSTKSPLDLYCMRLREQQLKSEEEQQAYDVAEVAGELIWIDLDPS